MQDLHATPNAENGKIHAAAGSRSLSHLPRVGGSGLVLGPTRRKGTVDPDLTRDQSHLSWLKRQRHVHLLTPPTAAPDIERSPLRSKPELTRVHWDRYWLAYKFLMLQATSQFTIYLEF